mgnify:CR=1 FL=1
MIAELNIQKQVDSFWNLIQFSDESVQKGLYALFVRKFGSQPVQTLKMDMAIPEKIEKRLNALTTLQKDWDGYGAPEISVKSIENCRSVLATLTYEVVESIEILPTEYGGVQIKKATTNGMVSCNFGDNNMSYYVDQIGKDTIYRSFVPYSDENIAQLKQFIES